jgi:hypothetical protein
MFSLRRFCVPAIAVRRRTTYHFAIMARYYTGNHQPLTIWNRFPIYLTTIITGAFILGFVMNAMFDSSRNPLFAWLVFTMPMSPAWSLWRLVSYLFVNQVNFFTPFAILCFYWWAVGIETHLGRVALTRLLLLLALVVPALSGLWWMFRVPSMAIGNYAFTGGLLVAFATLYPNTEVWGWIPLKWFAFACIACGSLTLFPDRDWVGLSHLWGSCAVGFAFIRHARGVDYDDYESPFARFKKLFRRQPKFRVVPKPPVRSSEIPEDETMSDIDALLDKIARSGIASLTPKERARLEKAREALLKKDRR